MRYVRPLVLLVAFMAASLALPLQAAEDVTVGSFVMELARVKLLDATNAATAARSLSRAGVAIPEDIDFSKALTEGDVTRLARLAGLNVTTTRPGNTFDSKRLSAFFKVFAYELQPNGDEGGNRTSSDSRTPDHDPYSKGNGGAKGKKKGHRSPTDPE